MGKYVTAHIPRLGYPLQGWVIKTEPPTLQFTDGTTEECAEEVTIVINPPPRPPSIPSNTAH